jgi:ABC-type lipoprotein release transport system permease subunit
MFIGIGGVLTGIIFGFSLECIIKSYKNNIVIEYV